MWCNKYENRVWKCSLCNETETVEGLVSGIDVVIGEYDATDVLEDWHKTYAKQVSVELLQASYI